MPLLVPSTRKLRRRCANVFPRGSLSREPTPRTKSEIPAQRVSQQHRRCFDAQHRTLFERLPAGKLRARRYCQCRRLALSLRRAASSSVERRAASSVEQRRATPPLLLCKLGVGSRATRGAFFLSACAEIHAPAAEVLSRRASQRLRASDQLPAEQSFPPSKKRRRNCSSASHRILFVAHRANVRPKSANSRRAVIKSQAAQRLRRS